MLKRSHGRLDEPENFNKILLTIDKLERTLPFESTICGSESCLCLICRSRKTILPSIKSHHLSVNLESSEKWVLKIMNGLASKEVPSLKLYVPDLCFVDGDVLQTFHTDIKTNRISKLSGSTPTRLLYSMMLKLKKQYKEMLEENYNKIMMSEVNTNSIHSSYIDEVLPSFFTDKQQSIHLRRNKSKFMKYVLHKDEKMLLGSIEEHKFSENEPFCTVKFHDGNMQLLSKKEFENLMGLRVPTDVVYVQSFIKEKPELKETFTSHYEYQDEAISERTDFDVELFNKAEREVLILIGGIGKYSDLYQDIDILEDESVELMKSNPNQYIKFTTYKIVHYLAMVSRVYVKNIKINWILNDLSILYLQNIFEFQATDIPMRNLKYRLPPKEENHCFYSDSEHFINLHKQMQTMKEIKRVQAREIIKKSETVEGKNANENDRTIKSEKEMKVIQSKRKTLILSKTLEINRTHHYNQSQSPQTKSKLMEDFFYEKKRKKTLRFKDQKSRASSLISNYNIM